MNIISALMKEDVQLSSIDGNRWLEFDGYSEKWVVYEYKPYSGETMTVCQSFDQDVAVACLLNKDEDLAQIIPI